ncbi:MAG: glycoside hydrolase family 43 protein [Sphaerochaeta sp.]|nr:glycoside hydrolase family 43 protein [Sphaerochaeta sp.]
MIMQYTNPVIPGFYPDPSVCRKGNDFYLACSSFEYFPGVPIFHSTDLVNWKQIGNALTRKSQLDLDHVRSSRGIFAPSLRYHAGLFYMITTDFQGSGHFFVTTEDPAGPWSDPVYIEGPGFDPDLFFDEDGTVYFIREDITGHGIRLWEINLATGKLIGPESLIWAGQEDRFCEAPHIYRIGKYYYLMVAEGGTHRGHMVMVGRASHPRGPYEAAPGNPILTHRCIVDHPLQATGHGDLIEDAHGSWWLFFLGIRQVRGKWHHLGRETFLAPVKWSDDMWPVINDGQPVGLHQTIRLPADYPEMVQKQRPLVVEYDFSQPIGLEWNFRGNPDDSFFRWSKEGGVVLTGTPHGLRKATGCAFLGRRQQDFSCKFSLSFSWRPEHEDDCAGLAVIMNENHFYVLEANAKTVSLRVKLGALEVFGSAAGFVEVPLSEEGGYTMEVVADRETYNFHLIDSNANHIQIGTAECRYLSTEVAGGFTGVYMGPFSSSGVHTSKMHVQSCRYERFLEE